MPFVHRFSQINTEGKMKILLICENLWTKRKNNNKYEKDNNSISFSCNFLCFLC